MTFEELIKPLAASLSEEDWTEAGLVVHLERRLPMGSRKLARPLARALRTVFPGGVAPAPALIAASLRARPEMSSLWLRLRALGQRPIFPVTPSGFRPDPALAALRLPPLADTHALADWLALSESQLVRFSDLHALSALNDSPFARHYRSHIIPKRDGRPRLIEEPKPFLKKLQRRLLGDLLALVPPHPAAYGFTRGRNCIQAAAQHAGEEIVVSFDLADFFPSISFSRVFSLFRTLGYPGPVARHLAGLTTTVTPPEVLKTLHVPNPLARHLPQGAPTSPALANLAAQALDRRLSGLARTLGATYTRYADDLTFAGDRHIAPILLRAVPEIAHEEGFRLNAAKTRAMTRAQRQVVTGLTVNLTVNTARTERDRLKATLHRLATTADPRRTDPAFLARLSGQIAWVEQVNPDQGARLRGRFEAIASGQAPSSQG